LLVCASPANAIMSPRHCRTCYETWPLALRPAEGARPLMARSRARSGSRARAPPYSFWPMQAGPPQPAFFLLFLPFFANHRELAPFTGCGPSEACAGSPPHLLCASFAVSGLCPRRGTQLLFLRRVKSKFLVLNPRAACFVGWVERSVPINKGPVV